MNKQLPIALMLVCLPIMPAVQTDACTGFLIADENVVLFGNSEDYWNPLINMWVIPAEKGSYGRVCFGYDDYFAQGGVNEKGLVCDGFATDPHKVTGSTDRKEYRGNIMDDALARCATVAEVIELFEQYNLAFMERCMLMFADSTGDAVIIEGDVFLRKSGPYQILTNFYQSQYPKRDYPCRRYKLADKLLSSGKPFDLDLCRRVLDGVHAEGVSTTLYSNVYDLKKGLIYLYHFHDFDHPVVIDVAAELKKGEKYVTIDSLFPKNPKWEKYKQQRLQGMESRRSARKIVEVDPQVLAGYVGKYKVPGDHHADSYLTVSLNGGKLMCQLREEPPVELLPTSPTEFFHLLFTRDIDVEFTGIEQGQAKILEVRTAGEHVLCERVE